MGRWIGQNGLKEPFCIFAAFETNETKKSNT
jgi:hypothetical protein